MSHALQCGMPVTATVLAASNGWVGYDTRELIRSLPNEETILKTLYSKFEALDASTVAARALLNTRHAALYFTFAPHTQATYCVDDAFPCSRVEPYIANSEFQPDLVAKASTACRHMPHIAPAEGSRPARNRRPQLVQVLVRIRARSVRVILGPLRPD
jgi:hypothetical protein